MVLGPSGQGPPSRSPAEPTLPPGHPHWRLSLREDLLTQGQHRHLDLKRLPYDVAVESAIWLHKGFSTREMQTHSHLTHFYNLVHSQVYKPLEMPDTPAVEIPPRLARQGSRQGQTGGLGTHRAAAAGPSFQVPCRAYPPSGSPVSWASCRVPCHACTHIFYLHRKIQQGVDLGWWGLQGFFLVPCRLSLTLGLGLSPSRYKYQPFLCCYNNWQDIRTFIQATAHIRPAFHHLLLPWDLNFVFWAMQALPFEPLATIDLQLLTWKLAFLLAISSARRVSEIGSLGYKAPFCIFHKDKLVLRTQRDFLPKVTSTFHINQDIVLPSFCPKPSKNKERLLHYLDVVRVLKFYIHMITGFRQSDSLFILYGSNLRGVKAPKASIARWIKLLITKYYKVHGCPVPFHVTVQFTQALSTSWARLNNASAEQLCKAAT
ncbi:uncharacterized protein LOC121395521 [Xenopus laevis]|uniref:Uncharacterized protein LOC121395521 n=1 Tax=Xenopus laevis TaxID=8355 RepID=A0A8J1L692_XENLA|nr:uncharacterized protein LOC121395521 [Xenopus laevis]